jgi:hypothetical protein
MYGYRGRDRVAGSEMTCLRMTLVIDASGRVKVNGSGGEVNDRGGRLGGEDLPRRRESAVTRQT